VSGLKKEKKTHDTALNKARETQAAARSEVLSKEKKIKKADKAVDKKA
jgi:structural maintenance of chromosome 1